MDKEKTPRIPLRFNKDLPPVFQIEHLECSYVKGKIVLKANDINIPRT